MAMECSSINLQLVVCYECGRQAIAWISDFDKESVLAMVELNLCFKHNCRAFPKLDVKYDETDDPVLGIVCKEVILRTCDYHDPIDSVVIPALQDAVECVKEIEFCEFLNRVWERYL